MIDINKFDELVDNRDSTKAIARLAVALEMDHRLQQRKFSLSGFNSSVDSVYPLRNKNALRAGKSTGNKLIRGEELRPTEGLIYGSDVARAISYALCEEGTLQWPNVRELVDQLGKPWTELLSLQPIDPVGRQEEIYLDALQQIDPKSSDLAKQLRNLSKEVAPMGEQIAALSSRIKLQQRTIADVTTENTKFRIQMEAIEKSLNELKERAEGEKDPAKRTAMLETHALLRGRFNKKLE